MTNRKTIHQVIASDQNIHGASIAAIHATPMKQLKEIKSPSHFGTFLKEVRKSKSLTQQQFADLSGVGRRFIVECEAGKPRLEFAKVLQVAAAAGIDVFAIKR